MPAATVPTVAAWLLTYLVHSTLLLGAVALATRWVVRSEALRETLWKAAMVGGLVTATLATTLPRPGLGRIALTALDSPAAVMADGPAERGRQETGRGDDLPGAPELEAGGGAVRGIDRSVDTDNDRNTDTEVEADCDGGLGVEIASGAGSTGPGGDAGGRRMAGGDAGAASGPAFWVVALVGIWGAIAGFLLLRLGYRHLRLKWLLRDRTQVSGTEAAPGMLTELRRTAGVWKPIRMTSSPAVGTPLALGGVEVCVPERFLTELGPEEQRAALAHELAHLVRRDPFWQVGGAVVGALFFFQPLNDVARRSIRSAAEYMADGWAVAQTGSRMELARCLAAVAAWVAPSREPALAGTVAMAEGGPPLLLRVQRLLENEPEAPSRPGLRLALAMAVIGVAVAFAPAVGGAVAGDGAAPAWESDGVPRVEGAGRPEPLEEDSRQALQAPLEIRRVEGHELEGDGFVARLNEAGRDAGQSSHWVAYALRSVETRRQVLIDSWPWNVNELDGPAVARQFGVEDEVGRGDVVMLVRLDPSGAATQVVRMAVRRPDMGMRVGGTVYWLGQAEPKESFLWVRDIFTSIQDPEIRKAAVDAIGTHPVAEAAPFLRRVLERDADSAVRQEAVEALTAQRPDTAPARMFFEVAMKDADPEVRRKVTEHLGQIREPLSLELLERLAWEAGDPDVQKQAAETLSELGTTRSAAALERLVTGHPRKAVRREALDQLREARLLRPETLLELALRPDGPDLRLEAVERMEELPREESVRLLLRAALESRDGRVERQAVKTLGEVGTEAAFQALLTILERNPGEAASLQAVESIAERFPRNLATRVLRGVLRSHPSSRVRREAFDQLEVLGG